MRRPIATLLGLILGCCLPSLIHAYDVTIINRSSTPVIEKGSFLNPFTIHPLPLPSPIYRHRAIHISLNAEYRNSEGTIIYQAENDPNSRCEIRVSTVRKCLRPTFGGACYYWGSAMLYSNIKHQYGKLQCQVLHQNVIEISDKRKAL